MCLKCSHIHMSTCYDVQIDNCLENWKSPGIQKWSGKTVCPYCTKVRGTKSSLFASLADYFKFMVSLLVEGNCVFFLGVLSPKFSWCIDESLPALLEESGNFMRSGKWPLWVMLLCCQLFVVAIVTVTRVYCSCSQMAGLNTEHVKTSHNKT